MVNNLGNFFCLLDDLCVDIIFNKHYHIGSAGYLEHLLKRREVLRPEQARRAEQVRRGGCGVADPARRLLEGGGGEEMSTLWQRGGFGWPGRPVTWDGGGGGQPTRPGAFLKAEGVRRSQRFGWGGGGELGGPAMQILEERGGTGDPARRLLDVGGTRRSQRCVEEGDGGLTIGRGFFRREGMREEAAQERVVREKRLVAQPGGFSRRENAGLSRVQTLACHA